MSKLKKSVGLTAAIVLTLAGGQGLARAQQNEETPGAAEQEATAIGAVRQMSRHLAKLDTLSVKALVSMDEVMPSGQKIQLDQQIEIYADPPGRLWAHRISPRGNSEYFYDGETFTVHAADLGFYASFDAPDTIGATIAAAEDRGVDWPLADLFMWGTDQDAIDAVESAFIVGTTEINGVSANHFAFRQAEVDWQIWIAREGEPLPLKLVITSTQEEGQPQYVALMKWDTSPDLSSKKFTFEPSADDYVIGFEATADTGDTADEE